MLLSDKTASRSALLFGLLSIFLLVSAKSIDAGGSRSGTYLSRDYIDSTVLQALLIMNEAASVAGVGFRQKQAIAEAKQIARQLRGQAKGDPNERYATWKIGELEWMIYLEEKDLVLQAMKLGERSINGLVAQYNTELGKRRPDFKVLLRYHTQMSALDGRRTDQMASSINRRSRAIAKEVAISLERALATNNATRANEEFRYCLRNGSALGFSDATIERFQDRVSACVRARDEWPMVRIEVDHAGRLSSEGKPGEARSMLGRALVRFDDIRRYISASNRTAMESTIEKIAERIDRFEDSLVLANLAVLEREGPEAANRFLQQEIRSLKVSSDRIARVDRAILGISTGEESSAISREIEEVAVATENAVDPMADLLARTAEKAQKKRDSIARTERKGSLFAWGRHRKNDGERAMEQTAEIYLLLEQNRSEEALKRFSSRKNFLKANLIPEAYNMLAMTVQTPSASGSGSAIVFLTPIEGGGNNENGQDDNREKALAIIQSVYGLLEHNDVKKAMRRFDREKRFLRTHCDREVYAMLKTTVTQAYRLNR